MRTIEVPGELELIDPLHELTGAAVPVLEAPAEPAADGKGGRGVVEGAVDARTLLGKLFWLLVHGGDIGGVHVEVDRLRTVAGVYGEDNEGTAHVLVFVC